MSSFYTIHELITPVPQKGHRFRIVESIMTCDGVRSRLTDRCSDNIDDLKHQIAEMEKDYS